MNEINGLPAHILLVHIVVIVLPLAAGAAILGSVWPRAQRKFTFLTPLAALGGLIAVPLTINAGQFLAQQLGGEASPALERHITLAGRVLPLAIALFVVTAAQWAYLQFVTVRRRWLTVVIAVVVIVVSAATAVQVILTGDAGSQAAWGGVLG